MTNKLILGLTILLATGCGQTSDQQAQSAALSSMSTCGGQRKAAVDPTNIDIKGASTANPGDAALYALTEDVSCNADQEVAWRTVAGGTGQAKGSAFVASFKKPGEYVVAAKITDPHSSTPFEVSTKTIVSADLKLTGPQYGMAELEHHFEVVIPADLTLAAAQWNFGDGNQTNGPAVVDHTYMSAGTFTVTVNVMTTNGDNATLTHKIIVLPPTDGLECVRELTTSGPTQANVKTPVTMSVYMPACVSFRVGSVRWNFGDAGEPGTSQTVSHTYTQAGNYTVSVSLYGRDGSQTAPILTLTRQIEVLPGEGEPEPEVPVEPDQCSTVGQTTVSQGEIYGEEVACGIKGKKTMSYRDSITQECRMVGEVKRWVESSRSKELTNEGECRGQACELPPDAMRGVDVVAMDILLIGGKYYLSHNGSKTFYSSQIPNGACSSVAQTRTCSNGVLGGSATNVFLMCNNGCAGVGPHGTVQTGVVVGETSVPKVCAYGETGVTDLFNVVADKTCDNGEVSTSNSRNGVIKTPGLCPTYSYVGTENYSACSADCGGKQTRVFECRDNTGAWAPALRCGENVPREERLCDGNPDAVKRSESTTSDEEAGSSVKCPSNQIGTIVNKRTVTTTKNYACVNHAVSLASTDVVPSAWVEERYCKQLVASRCSQDSLSNDQANGRYKWLLKCRADVPAIDDFLHAFESYEKMTVYKMENLVLNGRIVYPTFLDAKGKPWIAPKTESGSCSVPTGTYIATVCLASCATPEQMIMGENDKGKLEYASFIDSWQAQFKRVGTLGERSEMNSRAVVKTAVDQWVTELVDGNHQILEFRTRSGGSLRLTPNHPVLAVDGRMKLAGDFKVGDSLVKLGGQRDPIVSIRPLNHYGKVYNLFVKSDEPKRNIVVTNGYLNGTAFFQNEGADQMNRQLFRNRLVRGVFGK